MKSQKVTNLSNPMLYIHIPFCDSKCNYCSFNSYTNLHSLQNRYIDALIEQLKYEIERFSVQQFKSIYIGGGTPSTLSSNNLEKLFLHLLPYIKNKIEITIEANPNSISDSWLNTIFQLGVNRVSLGVQTFDNNKLSFLGRNHSQQDAIRSIEKASNIGFKNINIDLIYNTVLDTYKLLDNDIKTIFSLPISHVSMYSLTIEQGTPFANQHNIQKENLELTTHLISKVSNKFPQYEISNFGKPSQHNLGYWQGDNYIGLGSGAVGFLRDKRFYPQKDVKRYIDNPLNIEIEYL